MRSVMTMLASVALAAVAHGDPPVYDQQLIDAERAAIAAAAQRTDIPALRRLLDESSFYSKPAAAMVLARLGVSEALPQIHQLNEQYASFPCAESGEFGVAVILLEEPTRELEKQRLLETATADRATSDWAASVIDRAGRELAAYDDGGEVSGALANVQTYGAQYTVLYLRTRESSIAETIAQCIEQLREHKTPQQAEAAQDLLIGIGAVAADDVAALRDEKQDDVDAHSLARTIIRRCDRILREYEGQVGEAEPEDDPLERQQTGVPDDWIEIRPGEYFSLRVPPELKRNPTGAGIDSFVGEYIGETQKLSFDYGRYGLQLSNWLSRTDVVRSEAVIDGHEAQMISYRVNPSQNSEMPFVSGIRMPDVGDGVTGLTIWIQSADRRAHAEAGQILSTLRILKHPETDGNEPQRH